MKSREQIQLKMMELGYRFFTNGDYNLNIIGIRNKNLNTNSFNDELHCIYKVNGIWQDDAYEVTTKPGFYSLQHLTNSKGCAIMVPGQYPGSHKIGYHKGKYKALVQNKPIKVYRDKNLDKVIDLNPKTIDQGIFGVNIHKAGKNSIIVDNWSAGCQVFKRESDFNKFMITVSKSAKLYGNVFTYTLLNDW